MRISDWSSDVCSSDLRQVADDDSVAVIVVDRADLAEQRETVVALARGARRLDRPRPRRGMVEQFGLRHGLAIDIALDMTDVEPPDPVELVARFDILGGRFPLNRLGQPAAPGEESADERRVGEEWVCRCL